jgi:hypothetical protein
MSGKGCVLRFAASPSILRYGTPSAPPGFAQQQRMNSRICRCCGEAMPEKGNPLSRNPNICASCSSMADGMEESGMPESTSPAPETTEARSPDRLGQHAAEPVVHDIPA